MGLTPTGQLTPNIGFSFGGGNAFPPFGNFNPNAGGNLNLRGRNFRLGLNFAKGSTTTLGSQTASLIVPNGGGGSLFSGQMTPFVTGVVPIVGRFESDVPDNAVTRAIQSGLLDSMPPVPKPTYADDPPRDFGNPNSTALHGDRSVAALKAERQAFERRQQAKFESSLTEAKRLLAAEQFADSRRKFREAMQYTQDEQVKRELREVADSLKATKRK